MYFTPMNILIRLPNWLGDMVMSTAFVQAVKNYFPDATIDLIAKKGIDFLLDYFPAHGQRFVFSKEDFKGITGARRFGKLIKKEKKYDLFFCLPDSFSSAIMGQTIGAKERIGYKKELRSVFLTRSYTKKKSLHRVTEYIDLLQQFIRTDVAVPKVELLVATADKKDALIININSEAVSRRLPKEKAISIINNVRSGISNEIILVGSNKESEFVNSVFAGLRNTTNITNMAGKTTLPQLVNLLGSCKAVLTTDSGPAHVSDAQGIPTVVLFGAGNESNTAPWNSGLVIRLGQLACEPCVSNTCKLYGVPLCLTSLDENMIASAVLKVFN